MKSLSALAFILLTVMFSTPCLAETKIAVMNSREVVSKSAAGAQALKQIEEKFGQRRTQLKNLEQEVIKLQAEAKAGGEKSPKRAEAQAKIQKLRDDEQQFRKDVAEQESITLKPVLEKITKVISDYAKENSLTVIQEKGNLVYFDSAIDITDALVKKVDETK